MATLTRAQHRLRLDRLMRRFAIIDKSLRPTNQPRRVMVQAEPILNGKGEPMLALAADCILGYEDVIRLRNWLTCWVNHHTEDHKHVSKL